ncbi:hypothetical protein GO001_21260 [Streptomyces sp. NRRL B-1677]|uniref:hypothetical protein n=1 Tax=Streptomyces sp. NRRL B-1677 TaxID=2682966 RepID=UPI0018929584|nr:hypothetical protein [Streptomyces sp. NRRL B-1677]MBF6047741.1 hypothetical protein [Streptomyces sp. NRRL B-1677]
MPSPEAPEPEAAPAITVEVRQIDEEEMPEGSQLVTATLLPSGYPEICATFEYALSPGHALFPLGFSVRPAPGRPVSKSVELEMRTIRSLPLTSWEASARAHAEVELLGESISIPRERAASAQATAKALLERSYPDLDPTASKADARKYKSLLHLAEISAEYMLERLFGNVDAPAAIAKRREVNPATVRSWLHRARKAGLLKDI